MDRNILDADVSEIIDLVKSNLNLVQWEQEDKLRKFLIENSCLRILQPESN